MLLPEGRPENPIFMSMEDFGSLVWITLDLLLLSPYKSITVLQKMFQKDISVLSKKVALVLSPSPILSGIDHLVLLRASC